MARNIRLNVELLPEKVYLGISPDVQGLLVQADTLDLLREYADDIARILIEHQTGSACTEDLQFQLVEVPYVEAA